MRLLLQETWNLWHKAYLLYCRKIESQCSSQAVAKNCSFSWQTASQAIVTLIRIDGQLICKRVIIIILSSPAAQHQPVR